MQKRRNLFLFVGCVQNGSHDGGKGPTPHASLIITPSRRFHTDMRLYLYAVLSYLYLIVFQKIKFLYSMGVEYYKLFFLDFASKNNFLLYSRLWSKSTMEVTNGIHSYSLETSNPKIFTTLNPILSASIVWILTFKMWWFKHNNMITSDKALLVGD